MESAFSSEGTEHHEVLLLCSLRPDRAWFGVWFDSEKAELSSLFSISRIFPNGDANFEFSLETHEPRVNRCCWKKDKLFLRAGANKGWPLRDLGPEIPSAVLKSPAEVELVLGAQTASFCACSHTGLALLVLEVFLDA